MREERLVIDGLVVVRRACRALGGMALARGHDTALAHGSLELRDDSGLLHGGVRSLVPARRQRFHALHRRPGIVGDDRDQLALVHDLPHAAHGERRIARERLGDAAAFDRRERDQRHLREGRPGVDAELRAAVDLRGRVAPRGGAADEAEVFRGLERRWWRLRQRRGRRRELSVGQPPAGGGVQNHSALRLTGPRRHAPAPGRRLDQHQSRGRPRLAQRRPALNDRQRGAGRLILLDALGGRRIDRESVHVGSRRGGFHCDRIEVDLELFGDEHGKRGVGALPHLDLRHDEGDAAARLDAHVGVQGSVGRGSASAGAGPGCGRVQPPQRDAQHQRAADRAGHHHDLSARDRRRSAHGGSARGAAGASGSASRALRRALTMRNAPTATPSDTRLQKSCRDISPGVSAMAASTATMPRIAA